MKEKKMNGSIYFTYGLGCFASQLSWAMVGSYLSLYYTDVVGFQTGTIAILFLVAKIWDGINDPIMGTIMERTHTRWGRFRPYIVIGAPLLVIFTILTFTVPNFGTTGNLIYAYITYIGLGMAYTVTNVPYCALPAVMTRDSGKIDRLNTAQMMGMLAGQILLNLVTLTIVGKFDLINSGHGYQYTAALYAILALPMFWITAKTCKETVVVEKKEQVPVKEAVKLIMKNKNLLMIILFQILYMMHMMGRMGVAAYFYLYVAGVPALTGVFMMLPMAVSLLLFPLCPKLIEKFGKKKTMVGCNFVHIAGLCLIAFGPHNVPFMIFAHIVYGAGSVELCCPPSMIVESLDAMDDASGVRPDGTAFSLLGLGNKIGQAIGSAVGIALIGVFGYAAGKEITDSVSFGINFSVNGLPLILLILSFIPLLFYNLNEEKMIGIRERLKERNKNK